MTTSKEFRALVTDQKPFAGNSCKGVMQGTTYVVYSYDEPILIHKDGVWHQNSGRLSVTTARHISACKPFGVVPVMLSPLLMRALLKEPVYG